jgi:hypothetical protein
MNEVVVKESGVSFLRKLFGGGSQPQATVTNKTLDPRAKEMLSLMTEADAWFGTLHQRGRTPSPKDYSEYNRVRELGEEIHRMGGNEALQDVAGLVDARGLFYAPSLLNKMWDGIGGWRA